MITYPTTQRTSTKVSEIAGRAQIIWATFFFGMFTSGWLLAKNLRQQGYNASARKVLAKASMLGILQAGMVLWGSITKNGSLVVLSSVLSIVLMATLDVWITQFEKRRMLLKNIRKTERLSVAKFIMIGIFSSFIFLLIVFAISVLIFVLMNLTASFR